VLVTVRVQSAEQVQQAEQQLEQEAAAHLDKIQYQQADASGEEEQASEGERSAAPANVPRRVSEKVGRNDPCPCGSGKKYKQCHGKIS
ncbi:MAG: SEC-C metal-binding domain-containing protein, partial [Limnobacter sp.]